MRTYSRALIFNAGRDVEYDLRNDLFAHLEKLPLSFYQSQRTGDLMSRVINDISAVRVDARPRRAQFRQRAALLCLCGGVDAVDGCAHDVGGFGAVSVADVTWRACFAAES